MKPFTGLQEEVSQKKSLMLLQMPEPYLLYTSDKKIKSITVNLNKACIGNDSLAIIGRSSYHMVGSLGSCLRVRGPVSCPRVLNPGSCPRFRGPGSCLRVRGPIFPLCRYECGC